MRIKHLAFALLLATVGFASGCSPDHKDLKDEIEIVKARPGGRIDPLPQIQPQERFIYEAQNLRPPFSPYSAANASGKGGIRPDTSRRREFLERYPLDTLGMVGTIKRSGQSYGLIRDPDGLIHQVQTGNHLGQNDGRIVTVSQSEIALIEIISDGMGGFLERPAAVALSE